MKQTSLLLFILLIGFLLQSCTPAKPNTPLTVAQAFWTAALDGDVETAKEYLTRQSQANFKIILSSREDFVELGEQNITLSRAEILTYLTRHKNNQVHKSALRTILLNQQGQWLVDFDQTRDSMLGSELQSVIDQLYNSMRETIDKGVKVMGESVKKELEDMERSLQDTLKELDKELEKQEQNNNLSLQKVPPTTTL